MQTPESRGVCGFVSQIKNCLSGLWNLEKSGDMEKGRVCTYSARWRVEVCGWQMATDRATVK